MEQQQPAVRSQNQQQPRPQPRAQEQRNARAAATKGQVAHVATPPSVAAAVEGEIEQTGPINEEVDDQ